MSADMVDIDIVPALRVALEALAMVRDGRARLGSLLSVLEDQRPDMSWDAIMLRELFDSGAANQGERIYMCIIDIIFPHP